MTLSVSGHQPVYLPWLGLFHKIALADVFVVMDDAQYLEQDWNNRNKLKGSGGAFWLTVPVEQSSAKLKPIRDVRIHTADPWGSMRHWQFNHWRSIERCYRKAAFWDRYAASLAELYTRHEHIWLWELNQKMLLLFLDAVGMKTRLVLSSEIGFTGQKSDLVLDHARRLSASLCVVGKHGRDYIVEDAFYEAGVSLHFQDYRHPVYAQRFGDFASHLSVLDLLMNCGPDAREIICQGNVSKAGLLQLAQGAPRRIEVAA
jgi:hypothetical protein